MHVCITNLWTYQLRTSVSVCMHLDVVPNPSLTNVTAVNYSQAQTTTPELNVIGFLLNTGYV